MALRLVALWASLTLTAASREPLSVLEPMEGPKKVLVTGGAGFIGSHVADHLLQRGDSVVILDEVNDYYDVSLKEANLKLLTDKHPNVTVYRGDICNATLLHHIFQNEQPTWVCHMAARAGVRPSIQDPFVYVHSNVRGTLTLLDLSRHYGVHNFVFASSSSVYGGSQSTFFSETESVDHPVSPVCAASPMRTRRSAWSCSAFRPMPVRSGPPPI